jgi:hypothetical protein
MGNEDVKKISFIFLGILIGVILMGSMGAHTKINSLKTNVQPSYPTDKLLVPTQIVKLNEIYFIVDHDHHRVIYNRDLNVNIENWTTVDYEFAGPHSIASDGEIYVIDNTGRNEVLVFDSSFQKIKTFSNVGNRPHKVIYDNGKFYVLSSQSQEIYCYSIVKGELTEEYHKKLDFLGPIYIRSIKVIDNEMYFVVNNREVFVTNHLSGNYEVLRSYTLPSDFIEVVDVAKFNGGFYVSAMGAPETGVPSKLVRGSSLAEIANGSYTDIYSSSGMMGKPYFFEDFDSKLFFGEVGEVSNSIISLDSKNNAIVRFRSLGVDPESYIRSDKYPK